MMRAARLTIALTAAVALPAAAQETSPRGSVAVLFERYSFDAGLGFDDVLQLTIPVGVTVPLGRSFDVALSSGYSYVRVRPSGGGGDLEVSGALDTEGRLSWHVVPQNLVVFVTGAVPTGVETVDQGDLGVLSLLASDLIGFSAPTLGTGGNVGVGVAGAVPVGTWAVGLGANFREPLSYQPVVGVQQDLKPGREVRLRGGVEGPLAARSYLRVAGIFALRAKDEVGGATTNGLGNRVMGYLSLDQGLGNASLTIYAFDVFRGGPRIEETAVGAAILPRSNLLAAGARLVARVGPATSVVPRVEWRASWAALSDTDTALRSAGRSLRFGADVRQQLGQRTALVVQGAGLLGYVRQLGLQQIGQDVDFTGFRGALHLEITP